MQVRRDGCVSQGLKQREEVNIRCHDVCFAHVPVHGMFEHIDCQQYVHAFLLEAGPSCSSVSGYSFPRVNSWRQIDAAEPPLFRSHSLPVVLL